MLRISNISFPGLGIGDFSVDSEAFSIFGVSIAWYAVIITFGMICAVAYAAVQGKKIGVTLDDICDFALWTIPIGIIGARLYFVLTSLEEFDSFEEVINIRNGGLAIYGGIIAGAITVLVVSKVKKIDFLALADCVAPGVLLAQGIGRWGNFMNGEAFGAKTESFIRMGVQNIVSLYTFGTTEMVYVHPTFLYESLWNLLGVLLIYLYARYLHKKYDGELFIMTFGWYGLGRMFIEGLRMDSLYSEIFGLEFRTSQVLAATIFIVCLALYIYFLVKRPNKPFFCKEVALAEGEESGNDDKKDGKDVNFTEEEGADENGDAHSTDDSFESDSDEPTEDEEAEYCDKASTEENTEALSSDNEPSKGDLAEEIMEEVSSEEPASDKDGDEQPESDTETGVVEEDVSTSDENVDADETPEEKPENNSF